jgi:PAS domain S-box-containing protein
LKTKKTALADDRILKICGMLSRFSRKDFSARGSITEAGDELDAVIFGLNTLGEELEASDKVSSNSAARLEDILSVLLKYTLMDFSAKANVGDAGDEIDAIALGLNTLAEELENARQGEEKSFRELRQSEERFRLLIEHAQDYSIFMIDPSGYVISWNKGAEKIKGYTASEIIGKHISLFYTQEELQRNEPNYNIEQAKKFGHYESEGWRIRKDGTMFWADVVFTALYNEAGELTGFSKITRDITAKKVTEEKILKLNQELEQKIAETEVANKELEAFCYSVSHDLRAPLRAINGYTHILAADLEIEAGSESRQMMDAVMENAARMGQLIDDLLSFSRMGKKEIQFVSVDMNEIFRRVIAEQKNAFKAQKAEFRLSNLPNGMGDYSMINQVVVNLISNAVKYSEKEAKPFIEIYGEERKGEVVYSVKDNGVGFDMKYYNKLFGVFQRLHDSGSFEGNGVGLALAQRIVLRHGGRIWGESELGKGATFYFTLKKFTQK